MDDIIFDELVDDGSEGKTYLSEEQINTLEFVFGSKYICPFMDDEDDDKHKKISFRDIIVLDSHLKKPYFASRLAEMSRSKNSNVFDVYPVQSKRIIEFPSFMIGEYLHFKKEDQLIWWGMRYIQNTILFGKLADRQIIREINTNEKIASNFELDNRIKTDWGNDLMTIPDEICKIQSIRTMCGQCDFMLELYDLYLRVREGKEKPSCKLIRRAQMMKDSGFEESFMLYELLNSKVNCKCEDAMIRCEY